MATETVQASSYNVRPASFTELARNVSSDRGLTFNGTDELCDPNGTRIADNIEQAARAMIALGWLRAPNLVAVAWAEIPTNPDKLARQIRELLARNPRPDRIAPNNPDSPISCDAAKELANMLDLTETELTLLKQL